MNAEELLNAGIESAKNGDKAKAARLLAESVKLNPNSEQAWLWLGGCLTTPKEKEYCFKRVLTINPANAQAKKQLEKLTAPASPSIKASVPTSHRVTPTSSREKSISESSLKGSDQKEKNEIKILATLIGFLLGLLILGGPFAYIVVNETFSKQTMPFAAVLWTPTHTLTASATPTKRINNTPIQTATNIPSPTATLTYSQRMELADPFFTEGFKQYDAQNWAESILSWNQVIELVPEDEVGYYMRGQAYMGLLDNNRYFDEYISNLEHAITDFDSAITINPKNGNYYLNRFYAYSALANSQETRADFLEFEKIASQNLDMAFYYGNTTKLSKRNIPFTLIDLGECDKAIDEINKQFSEQTEPSGTLNEAMALAQFCKGSPNKALNSIDNAIKITENCQRNTLRAKILYGMGMYSEAETEINKTLNRCPYYGGDRYFLRGLIYIAMGEIDKAQQDLDFGIGETWAHGGLYPYALGKIALANNDTESAIFYFQAAEATYFNQDMILEMIRADLAKLNAQPLEVELIHLNSTSIPTPTITLTPRPSSTPKAIPTQGYLNKTTDPNLVYSYIIDLEKGTGPFKLHRNESLYFRFQAPEPIDILNVQSLSIWLVPSDSSQQPPTFISLFSQYGTDGGINVPLWGENKIDFPRLYVTSDGDVYIEIFNNSLDDEVQIENVSVSYTAQTKDGNVALYGYTP